MATQTSLKYETAAASMKTKSLNVGNVLVVRVEGVSINV